MHDNQPTAAESPQKKPVERAANSVRVVSNAYSRLTAEAKKRGLSHSEYTSAAILYFAENGLDPTQAAGLPEGSMTRQTIGDMALKVLGRDDENTNRLMGMLRRWEQDQYRYLQVQEGNLLAYLERIERNILSHQVSLESDLLLPMIELILRGSIDAHMSRMQAERVLAKLDGVDKSEWPERSKTYDTHRERKLVEDLRALLQKYVHPKPTVTARPGLAHPPTAPINGPVTPTTATTITPKQQP